MSDREENCSGCGASIAMTDITKLPYQRVIIPEADSGTYTGFITELPGCIVQGDSPQEVYDLLNDAAKDWIAAAKDLGQEIPRVILDLPNS